MEDKEIRELMLFARSMVIDSFAQIIKDRTPEAAAEYFVDFVQNVLVKQASLGRKKNITAKAG